MSKIRSWILVPNNLASHFSVVVPIIISQIFQRLYPMIDNRYVAMLGPDALYLHGIQYNFTSLGQFIGLATYLSCLVFWKRADLHKSQGAILIKHLLMAGFLSSVICLFCMCFMSNVLSIYRVNPLFTQVAKLYLRIGLCNMIFFAIYGGLDGMLVGSGRQKWSMCIAGTMAIGNLIIDRFIVLENNKIPVDMDALYVSMKLIGLSTSLLLILSICVSFYFIYRQIKGWRGFSYKDLLPVWWGELVTYLLRGVVPFIFSYQLCFVGSTSRFLNTYQLGLHLSYLFCFPLIAALQVAVRDAVKEVACTGDGKIGFLSAPSWWGVFFYTGMLPSSFLILLGILMPAFSMKLFYGYIVPDDHAIFLTIFYIGCWIGQFGNAFSISLRAAKKNYLVTKNFMIGELIVMIGGTQLLIYTNNASPITLGFVILLFTASYTIANGVDAYMLKKAQKEGFFHAEYS